MTLEKWEQIERRVASLEKQNRSLKLWCIVATLCLFSAATLGQTRAQSTTVEAQRFLLKNQKGEIRAELTTLGGDYPKLTISSSNGEKAAEISPLGMSVIDHGLPGKLPLAYFGNTGLYFTNQQGQLVVEVGGASTSALQIAPVPEIKIFNDKEREIWHAPPGRLPSLAPAE